MKPLLLLLLMSNGMLLYAQTSDQFTDGDFTQNPAWVGDDSLFKVNSSFQLQSKGTTAKDLSLTTASSTICGEWHFWCRFNLSPSTSNFMRVYLMSDSVNLKGALNGYYVQLGGVTGNADSITLYKQKGTARTRIIGGRPGTVSKTNNLVRVKVFRDQTGNWQLFSDTNGGYGYVLEGTGTDNELVTSSSMGIFVRFTSSNAQNYYLDDVYAGPMILDTVPPRLDSVQVLSDTLIRLVFSENVMGASALDPNHYAIDNGIKNPLSVQFEGNRNDVVLLKLRTRLTNNTYELVVSEMMDLAGNMAAITGTSFVYYVYDPEQYDLLISEFFPDPSPVVGLPETEFVELYNNSSVELSVKGWSISDGTSTAVLPDSIIAPQTFMIICTSVNNAGYSVYGKTVVVNSLPSLNNSGDQIILKTPAGKIIHQIQYDLSWYHSVSKSDGGYSIEMDHPKQLCKGKLNYGASDDMAGGTPGRANSRWSLDADTTAPQIKNIHITDNNKLLLVFNEPMDSGSMLTASVGINPLANISSRQLFSVDTLLLELSTPLLNKQSYTIELKNFRDCSGNILVSGKAEFDYLVADTARTYDVLINEMMVDPEPAAGLPEVEYLELYNRSERLIDLKDWTIQDGTTIAHLPAYLLKPDSFVVLLSQASRVAYSSISNTIGLTPFPSLGNDGDQLTLKNQNGYMIHHLEYTSAVYKHTVKKNGGWSLELVDAENPCGNNSNLRESEDKSGGTPGRVNSVKGHIKDQSPPKLMQVYPVNERTLELRFNEPLDSTTQCNTFHYLLNTDSEHPLAIVFQFPSFQRLRIEYDDSFSIGKQYKILVSALTDCAGNVIESGIAEFGLPEPLMQNDLVINEILFDPRGDGSDFVEVYNRSEHSIDLKNIYLANADETGEIKDFYAVDTNGLLLMPHEYMVLTDNPANIMANYTVQNPKQLVQCKMPSYSNDEGTCLLIDLKGNRYDELRYSDKMHFALLDNKDGVSLERIDVNRLASDQSNWTSASFTSGYGTPTARNSQYVSVNSKGDFSAQPEVFSPDGDGYNDLVHFSYQFEQPGYTGNLKIYNASGQLQKNLLRNEILGTNGVFSWDGITDNGTKAPIGIYLCYFEAFTLNGDIIRKKVTTVVGGKL
jgi:hypothetical protein